MCPASAYRGGAVSSLANKLPCDHSLCHPDIKAADPAYCLVSSGGDTITYGPVLWFIWLQVDSGQLRLSFITRSILLNSKIEALGGGRWNRSPALRLTRTQERDLIRQFIQRPVQLSSLVTLYFSLPLFCYFSLCAKLCIYLLVCLIWYSKMQWYILDETFNYTGTQHHD